MKKLERFSVKDHDYNLIAGKVMHNAASIQAFGEYLNLAAAAINGLIDSISEIDRLDQQHRTQLASMATLRTELKTEIDALMQRFNNLEEDACANPAQNKEIWDEIGVIKQLIAQISTRNDFT
jgi:uncharacterized phage infection (PIP) family protein YhgE